jgi:protein-L-isoaspartate(D-aspartate) O-methyltransferase
MQATALATAAGALIGTVLLLAACAGSGPSSGEEPQGDAVFLALRARMVEDQIRARGVRDSRVLAAMRKVPRHRFVPDEHQAAAYGDHPLPIGFNQTISQPYIVAFMTEALRVDQDAKVLEIGTGSGYQAAILGEIVAEVYTIEIVSPLAARAAALLEELGYANVHVKDGDGYAGWPERAPFDAIMVTAAPDHVPQPLVDQLAVGGRMVIPVGVVDQELRVLTKQADGQLREEERLPVRFVPLTRRPGE